jgi:UDP-GlcNAc:undecaprenyl-phosphate/decaprenyl-phosphate GlcNAc-1-phosphate transferase
MLDVLLTGSVSFIITFLSIPVVMRVAEQKKLFDVPDARKLHTKPIASLGGVGIFCGFFMSALLSISNQVNPEFQYFLAAAIVIFFLGIKDDILVITPFKKFLGQVMAAAIVIHLGHVRIDSMYGFMGINELPEAFSLGISYVTIILIINAYNLIDGVDGLAGTLGLLTMSVFGSYFYLAHMPAYSLLSFAMGGSLLAFLIFNYNPAKIFMGDSGSLMLGLINAILTIKFIQVAGSPVAALPIESAVAVGVAILMVPLTDTLRVFGIRMLQGRSPFSPDRNHIHHLFLDRGMNHKYVTFSCLLLNISFIAFAYYGRSLGPTLLLLAMAATSLGLLASLIYFKKPVRIARGPQHSGLNELHPVTKVVSIHQETEVAVAEQ